jgi:ribose 5-phosphate isomerase A
MLDSRAGIMGHGLFIGLAREVVVAGAEGIRILEQNQRPMPGKEANP